MREEPDRKPLIGKNMGMLIGLMGAHGAHGLMGLLLLRPSALSPPKTLLLSPSPRHKVDLALCYIT